MTPSEFLDSFKDLDDCELHTLRRSTRLLEWTQESELYVSLAKQMFPGDREYWPERQRFVSILREMLYTDGRSLSALLFVADIAACDSEYDANGINALAGIYCYLLTRASTHTHLLETFRRLAQVPELKDNATNCIRLITRDIDTN